MLQIKYDSDPAFDSWYKLTLINPEPDSDPGTDSHCN